MNEEIKNRIEPPPVKPKKKSKSIFVWVFGFFLFFALLVSLAINLILVLGFSLSGGAALGRIDGGVDEFPRFEEEWSYGLGEVKVVRIPVKGVIARIGSSGFFGPKTDKIESILNQIRFARRDKEVRAIILEVDSPGGAVTPSDEIYDALKKFKQDDPERKILVFTKDLAASGGYYVAMAADHFMAEPTAIIGSIGVIMQTYNWHELSQKIGVTDTTIKSGENKDLLNPFRAVSTNQLDLLQGLVDDMYDRFLGIVVEGRGMDREKAKELCDGRVFSSGEAKELGLIDALGYWDDAVDAVSDLLGEEAVKIVRYIKSSSFMDMLGGVKVPDRLQTVLSDDAPKIMYIWRP